ncbi:Urease accessory protein UreG OS=Streptomyces alboniger OX=132473 GN=ureG PE=3 SV=1 [Streptomyces alboniger]
MAADAKAQRAELPVAFQSLRSEGSGDRRRLGAQQYAAWSASA